MEAKKRCVKCKMVFIEHRNINVCPRCALHSPRILYSSTFGNGGSEVKAVFTSPLS